MNPPAARLDDVDLRTSLEYTLGWRPLRYYTAYRVVLAAIFLLLAQNRFWLTPIAQINPGLFADTALAYAGATLLAIPPVFWRKPSLASQTVLMVFIDIVTIVVLMQASGGVASGLGILLLISVAAGGLILGSQLAFLFAALASLASLAEEANRQLTGAQDASAYTSVGLLGMTLFMAALVSQGLSRRVRSATALAEARRLELAESAELNEQIIQRMQSGVIAVDRSDQVRLVNRAAMELLGMPITLEQPLQILSPQLVQLVGRWRENPDAENEEPRLENSHSQDISVRFAALPNLARTSTLIFLEDRSAVRQKAQLMKMAALGSLSGGIAHEIRNPLGAIGNAAELLEESPGLAAADRSLLTMIQRHCARVNRIVEDILNLGRRDQTTPERVDLPDWLAQYHKGFIASHELKPEEISLRIDTAKEVRMDPAHLRQIMDNLCENALKYAEGATELPRIELVADADPISERPMLT
ncbi:MAG: hypothetical protein J4A00_11060, partial [Gammaproteobacteria bacterium]|nr:hypothetical protein [Gammaproteobacteria bacterium]